MQNTATDDARFGTDEDLTTILERLRDQRQKIAAFYPERSLQKRSLFGSVVLDDFDLEHSNVDVLVEFR